MEQMKTEVKAQPVSKMREVLRYTLPGNSIEEVRKVPKVMPAAAFVRKEGVMTLNEYNGIVMMEVNNLSGRAEADEIKELVKELMKDRMFYEQSGGGVTLSGGEVMAMSTDYILQIAKALKKEEISLTIDTCGYVSYDKFEAILPYVDTFLYDVKVMDPELHKKYIGVDNKLILDNLVKLSDAGARIYIRIPTIKEVNGNVQNMEDTIHFLKKHGIHPAQVNLLPYHNTGSSKYPKLGMEYKGTDLHAPEKEEMESFVKLFQDAGYINTKIGG